MKITIEPTGRFFMYAGIAVRVWSGQIEGGEDITALVAAVSGVDTNVIGITPIPPPSVNWSQNVRFLMTRLWQLGDRMTAQEANDLAVLAEGWIETRERKARRALAAQGQG